MLKRIPVDQVCLGMYVQELCGPWLDHPFWKTRFVIRDAADLVGAYLRATRRPRRIVRFPMPGRAAAAVRAGAVLAPDHAVGARTWEEFLADQALG